MSDLIGAVFAVSGAQTIVVLNSEDAGTAATRIGAVVRIGGELSDVVGTVSAIRVEPGARTLRVVVLDLLGELIAAADGGIRFRKGVADFPLIGAPVYHASAAELTAIYAPPSVPHVRVGALYNDALRPAVVLSDDLLSNHFAILGASGSGKSCTAALILSRILDTHPNAHILVLDPHNEYFAAFGNQAEILNIDNLRLPLWLLNFEEASEILIRGGTPEEREAQSLILHNVILRARRDFGSDLGLDLRLNVGLRRWSEDEEAEPSLLVAGNPGNQAYAGLGGVIDPAAITVDTPVPYGTAELLRLIDEAMAKFERPDRPAPYLRLKGRIEALRADPRFAFMFSDALVVRDTLAQLMGRLMRFPVAGRPITIMDLSAVPAEIADVVVSLLCRLAFDFALWAGPGEMPPVLLVCEEAHRYVPADPNVGFAATARSIGRIAKEGRKYGISLGLVSQRPSELSPAAISQCATVFAMRLPADLDQRFVSAALPEAGRGLLGSLANLATQEAIVCGQGVALPMRIRFDDLPANRRPRSSGASFAEAWGLDSVGSEFVHDNVRRWRLQSREETASGHDRRLHGGERLPIRSPVSNRVKRGAISIVPND